MCWASMIASAAPTRVAARSNSPRSVAIDASPLSANGVVNWSPVRRLDLQRLAGERLGGVEVAELALDHAEIGGLGGDQEFVASRADERQPLRHPVARLGQVAGDLGADAEEVERVRAPQLRRPRHRSPRAPRARAGGLRPHPCAAPRAQDHRAPATSMAHRRAGGRSPGPARRAPTRARRRPSRTA